MRHNVPDYVKEYVDRAARFENNDQYDGAIDVLRQALTLYPNIAVLHNNLGCALANQGKYEEARNEFLQAIALTVANRRTGIVTPESYPQEPVLNLRAVQSYIKGVAPTTLPTRMSVAGSPLQLNPSSKIVMKIPEKVEFKFLDLLPVFAVWKKQNKKLIQSALALGFICGAFVGCVTGLTSWGKPFYYAWYFGISVEVYALVSAIKIVEKRHYQNMNAWILPWLRISYWIFFFLLVEGAVLLLEMVNSGSSWFATLQSSQLPNGIAYSNTLNAILIGILAAFPSKILLRILSEKFKFELPFPFSEFAETTMGEIIEEDEPILVLSSKHKEAKKSKKNL